MDHNFLPLIRPSLIPRDLRYEPRGLMDQTRLISTSVERRLPERRPRK